MHLEANLDPNALVSINKLSVPFCEKGLVTREQFYRLFGTI